MPVNKFGQMFAERVETRSDGVSASFVQNNFVRRNVSIDMSNHYISNTLDPADPQDVATKNYVDTRQMRASKSVIAVWAEESGTLREGEYEWSFGNGASGSAHRMIGYCIPVSGRIIMGSISALANITLSNNVRICIVINGIEQSNYAIIKAPNQWSGHVTYETPLELNAGDRINFVSKSTDNRVSCAIVSVLIELDL